MENILDFIMAVLPWLALGLNCVALFLNITQQRKQQRKEELKE